MVSSHFGPMAIYREALHQCTPDAMALALVALTAGDVRPMLFDTAELAAALNVSVGALRKWSKRNSIRRVRVGHRVYVAKLHVILALHGNDIPKFSGSFDVVGMPPWASKVGDKPL